MMCSTFRLRAIERPFISAASLVEWRFAARLLVAILFCQPPRGCGAVITAAFVRGLVVGMSCLLPCELLCPPTRYTARTPTQIGFLCEHTFVTSQGHPYARFRRALASGNAHLAEAAARELTTIGLADALELALLYREDPERYER